MYAQTSLHTQAFNRLLKWNDWLYRHDHWGAQDFIPLNIFSSPSSSPKSTLRIPGNKGQNPWVASLSQLMDMAANVRPWKQPQYETIMNLLHPIQIRLQIKESASSQYQMKNRYFFSVKITFNLFYAMPCFPFRKKKCSK